MRSAGELFTGFAAALATSLVPTGMQSIQGPDPSKPLPPTVGYTLLATHPHDRYAFTQGLHFEPRTKTLLESTGLYGGSSARRVEIESGHVLDEERLERRGFGEGLSVVGDVCYQLLWREGLCLIRCADTLALRRTAALPRGMLEGWGLTTDGAGLLYASDGSSTLHVLDAQTLEVTRRTPVSVGGRPLRNINDLQFVRGEIWANVWREDKLACIDPTSGDVRAFVDLSPLLTDEERSKLGMEECLNGLAYDEERDELFVTGKCWPKLFRLRVHR